MSMYIPVGNSHVYVYPSPDTVGESSEIFPAHFDNQTKVAHAICLAVVDADNSLPAGAIYEIRAKVPPTDRAEGPWCSAKSRDALAAEWGVAWYTTIAMQLENRPLVDVQNYHTAKDPSGGAAGYLLIARLKAGDPR